MQQPTCVNTRVRSTKDAQKIVYAAYLGRLPAAHRRLDGEERAMLRSGHSYAWEEKPNNQHTGQGMERWTEGKKWGPSRVRDVSSLIHADDTSGKVLNGQSSGFPLLLRTMGPAR
jgi:Gti1/Pac2 family transcription factor